MLEAIKSIINRKMNFMETADIILEDFDNNEIMDSLTDDEIADSGDIGSSKDDLKLDDDSEELSNNDSEIDTDFVEEVSSEDENEAIMSVTIDTRSNKITDLDLDTESMGEDTNPMDAFLDEHFCENRMDYYFFPNSESKTLLESSNDFRLSRLDSYFFASENFNPYFTEAIGDDLGNSSSDAGSEPPPAEPPAEGGDSNNTETEVTTAVKEQLADDQTGGTDASSDVTDLDNFGDSSGDTGMDDMGTGDEGSDKTQKGKELLKQAKKLEDNIIEYFF